MAGIVLEGVTKRFSGGVHAVRDLDLTVEDGELLVLVARGFHDPDALITMIMLDRGGLGPDLPWAAA